MNKNGAITRTNREWGSKARKEEDAQRGINNRARRQNCDEQMADVDEGTAPFSWEDWFARDISGEDDNWYDLLNFPEDFGPYITAQEA